KRVTFSGWIKTENVHNGYAGLWWRADGANRELLGFDNMARKGPRGTNDWARFSITLDVPAETLNINFGVLMPGKGKAWFDGLEVKLDGKEYQNAERFDFDFESDEVKGLTPMRRQTYRTRLDKHVAKVGAQSLLLESVGDDQPDALPVAVGLRGAREVLASLEQASDDLSKSVERKELEWTLQNARIVSQCFEKRASERMNGGNVRDRCMAENVAWILENNPQAKIILWAHNGHVAKQNSRMGKHLDDMFGDKHLAVAFSTSTGTYQAIKRGKGLSVNGLQAPPEGSVEDIFRRTGIPRFVLDLREVSEDSDESGWLAKPTPFRHIGALATERQFLPENLYQMYDAVIHIEETSAARPLKR
ncbi:MAG: erythromycin esterase family protein, partial [Planctomycetota bacterium]